METKEKRVVLVKKEDQVRMNEERKERKLQEVITKYKEISKADVEALVKVYLLQNYVIEEKYFKGSKYSKNLLGSYKSQIKRVTEGKTNSIVAALAEGTLMNTFIKELMEVIRPYPVMDSFKTVQKGPHKVVQVSELLKSKLLTKKEIDYIKSSIREVEKEKSGNRSIIPQSVHDFVCKHYNESIDFLVKHLPNINRNTLCTMRSNYQWLSEGKEANWYNKRAIETWKRLNGTVASKKIEKVVKEITNISKIENSSKVTNPITKLLSTKYAAICGGTICKTEDNLDYLKGYVAAHNELANYKLDIVKVEKITD